MEVINYLNRKASVTKGSLEVLEALKKEYGIEYSLNHNYPRLVVLNYNTITSKKHNPLVNECRSLVLEMPIEELAGTWTLVSSSFDRFYNLGELECGYNMDAMVGYEKMDGSIIGLFFYEGEWLYRTRSVIMPEGFVNAHFVTWKELIEEALGETWFKGVELFRDDPTDEDRCNTFILEVTSPDNRVVTKYEGRKMTLLAVRNNITRYYVTMDKVLEEMAEVYGWGIPTKYTFKSVAECVSEAAKLRDLKEGFVLYGIDGAPAFKCKNPAYCAAHHLRGDVLTPRRIMDLVIMNETDEYLSIFPEDTPTFQPYMDAWVSIFKSAEETWEKVKDITDAKEFASHVAKMPISALMFGKKQGRSYMESMAGFMRRAKYRLIARHLVDTDLAKLLLKDRR